MQTFKSTAKIVIVVDNDLRGDDEKVEAKGEMLEGDRPDERSGGRKNGREREREQAILPQSTIRFLFLSSIAYDVR